MPGGGLAVEAIILSQDGVNSVVLHWRALGEGDFAARPLEHVARGVYAVTLPARGIGERDIEYYVEAALGSGERVLWPATAPNINHTVVIAVVG